MNAEIWTLTITAATIGFVHTLFGPDHYLPFIVLSKARKWTVTKTISITLACGIGHVASSIVIGSIGVAFGFGLNKLELFESTRGDWAAWALFIFGMLYLLWGLYRMRRNKPHKHIHFHNGESHIHEHTHEDKHDHIHNEEKAIKLTPWILFMIFVLGPCEPLIPILMFPAAKASTVGLVLVSSVFAICTISTMLIIVLLFYYGFKFLKLGKIEKYTPAIAGILIALSAAAIIFLGL